MCLTAVPVYLLARLVVPKRVALVAAFASILTSAMFYATFLLPEALAYPVFAAVAYLCVRSLAGGGRRWTIAAIVGCLVATQVRGELATLAAAYVLAAAVVLATGSTSKRIRARWSILDHVGAGVLVLGILVVLNQTRERPLTRVRRCHPGVQASNVEPRLPGGVRVCDRARRPAGDGRARVALAAVDDGTIQPGARSPRSPLRRSSACRRTRPSRPRISRPCSRRGSRSAT